MVDKSYEFKRKSLYWYSVLNSDSDTLVQGYSDDTFVDRYSAVSALLFNRLLSFESVVSPYTVINNEQTYKTNPFGNLVLPKNSNLNSFIVSKRSAFNKIGIESIVHDTNVIGQMINQMEGSLKNGTDSTITSAAIREHREGINSCLKYVYQIVRDDVENYERFKLKSQSSLKNSLRVMTENLSDVPNLDDPDSLGTIPNSYLSHFIPSGTHEPSQTTVVEAADTQSQAQPQSGHETTGTMTPNPNVVSLSMPTPGHLGSLKYEKGAYTISTNFIDPSEMENEQVSAALTQQHSRMVNNITDQLKAAELRSINDVQDRITEISSMFVKFTGTVAVQNEALYALAENVQESLTNIEMAQESLKKSTKEGMPLYHLYFCYALVALSVFLLFVDFLKSRGSYLF